MRRFYYSAAADADLDEITDYFSANNPGAGVAFLNARRRNPRGYVGHSPTSRAPIQTNAV